VPYYRRRPRAPKPPQRLPAPILPQQLEEFHTKPHGSHGEMYLAAPPQPTVQTSRPLIPPPPWAGEVAPPQPEPEPVDPAALGASALADLKDQLGEDAYDPPPMAGPVVRNTPLQRAKIPEVDWRAEELERP
jgi:hypothetical protein